MEIKQANKILKTYAKLANTFNLQNKPLRGKIFKVAMTETKLIQNLTALGAFVLVE